VNDNETFSPIVSAALRLASERDWATITLADIAAEAGMALPDLIRQAATKTDILALATREIDERLLASLATDPVDGEAHDRLFDTMLRRLEIMTPHKASIASIAKAPHGGLIDWAAMFCTALASLDRVLAAARFETRGNRGDLLRLGFLKLQADMLRVWLDDDDPGLARTMAQLDRRLRDTEVWADRLETPFNFLSGLMRAFRRAAPQSQTRQDGSSATAD
jgi:AcrR family transcriptional regulator